MWKPEKEKDEELLAKDDGEHFARFDADKAGVHVNNDGVAALSFNLLTKR